MRTSVRPPSLEAVLCVFLLGSAAMTLASLTSLAASAEVRRNPDGTAMIPAEVLLADIKSTPWSGREALRSRLKDAEAAFAQRLPEWEARKNSLPEKARNAAETDFRQLVRMREVLRQRIDDVENAAAETWESAKYDLYVVLQNTIATYKKLRARFDP